MMLNRQMLVPSLFADTPTKEVDWGRTSSSPKTLKARKVHNKVQTEVVELVAQEPTSAVTSCAGPLFC